MKQEDITDVLDLYQIEELINMVNEASDFNTIDEDEYEKATAKCG